MRLAKTVQNILHNAARPSYLPTMLSKVAKRLERDTGPAAMSWAAAQAESLDEYCSRTDWSAWREAQDTAKKMSSDARRRLSQLEFDLGGGGAYPLLTFLVRRFRPEIVVETGVAAGWSTRAILAALEANGAGHLYSSDFPYFRLPHPERFVGWVVPEELRSRWTLDLRGDRRALPRIAQSVAKIDLLHYDSDKSYGGRRFAMSVLMPCLAHDAIVVMDDIQDNVFFRDWVLEKQMPYHVFSFEGKYVGLLGLDKLSLKA